MVISVIRLEQSDKDKFISKMLYKYYINVQERKTGHPQG